jgi:hypothetical protein
VFASLNSKLVVAFTHGCRDRAVVLAHGWNNRTVAVLANVGFRMLAFDFRCHDVARTLAEDKDNSGVGCLR